MKKICLISLVSSLALTFAVAVSAQKKAVRGKVCGDPTKPCKVQDRFQPNELPFDSGPNFVIAESERFYAVILSSVKIKNESNCENEKLISEDERINAQALFPLNKVFVARCSEPGNSYYTNVANGVSFMAVFAGRTQAEANKFMQAVIATGKYTGVKLRLMRTGINGT